MVACAMENRTRSGRGCGRHSLGMSIEEAAKTLAVPRNVLSNWLNGYVLRVTRACAS